MRIINQMVDTLKLHYYPSSELNEVEITSFNNFIEKLKELKEDAKLIKNDDNDLRYIKTEILNISFNVMARSVKSFSAFIQNGDITIALKSITDKSSNPIIKVEFRSEFLARNGYVKAINQVNKIISSFLPLFQIKVSEIHLATDVQGYNLSKLDRERFRFRNRTLQDFSEIDGTMFASGNKTTGFSFGKDNFMMRVYDKTHQISKVKKAGYVKVLRWEQNPNYNENEKVWRIEFQFRREYLKTLVGKDGILDGFENVLNSIPDLWSHAHSRFTHNDLSDNQCIDVYRGYFIEKGVQKELSKNTQKMRIQRAGLSPFWETISCFNNFEPKIQISKFTEAKKPEVEYVINAFKGVVSTFVKLNRGNFDKDLLSEILIQANEEEINKKGFSILDNARFKAVEHIDQMRTNYLKNGLFVDGFDDYKNDLKQNLLNHFNTIEIPKERNRFMDEIIKRGTFIYAS